MQQSYHDYDELLKAKYVELNTKIDASKKDVLRQIPEPERVEMPDLSLYANKASMDRVLAWIDTMKPQII